jgi:hypothetical protein
MVGDLSSAEPLERAGQTPSQPARLHAVGLRIRELPPEEFPRLRTVLEEYREGVDERTAKMVVAEDETGAIVATWGIFATVHVEPLWVAPQHRKNPGLIRGLWSAVSTILHRTSQKVSFAVLNRESPALPLAERLDFEKIDGSLYWVRFKGPREHWGEREL